MTKIQTSSFLILGFSVIILSLIFGSVHAVDEANEKLIESAFSLLKEEKFEPVSYTHLTLPTILLV